MLSRSHSLVSEGVGGGGVGRVGVAVGGGVKGTGVAVGVNVLGGNEVPVGQSVGAALVHASPSARATVRPIRDISQPLF